MIQPQHALTVAATYCASPPQVIGALLVIGRTNPALLAVAAGVVPLLARAMRVVVVRTARRAYRQRNAAADALAFANERLTQVCCRLPEQPDVGLHLTSSCSGRHQPVRDAMAL